MELKVILEEYWRKHPKGKKSVYILIIILCVGIGIIVTVDTFQKSNEKTLPQEALSIKSVNSATNYEDALEVKLIEILSKIEGVGRVSVMITLANKEEVEIALEGSKTQSNTKEEDKVGGVREINENKADENVVLINGEGGGTKPIIIKEISPKIKGVIVVADGAKDSDIKQGLYRAVESVLDVPMHKINVFVRN